MALGWPWGGLGVALGGFAQPPFWFQLSVFSISAFAKVWLCAALFLISAFSFQHFSFCPIVALGWLARPVTNHESRITSGFRWLCPAFRCWKLDVGCSMSGVDDKSSEYNSPPAPPWGRSGTTLVPSYTHSIPQTPPFQSVTLIQTTFARLFRPEAVFGFGCLALDVEYALSKTRKADLASRSQPG